MTVRSKLCEHRGSAVKAPLALVSPGAHPRQADGADRRGVRDGGGHGRRLRQDELALADEAAGDEAPATSGWLKSGYV